MIVVLLLCMITVVHSSYTEPTTFFNKFNNLYNRNKVPLPSWVRLYNKIQQENQQRNYIHNSYRNQNFSLYYNWPAYNKKSFTPTYSQYSQYYLSPYYNKNRYAWKEVYSSLPKTNLLTSQFHSKQGAVIGYNKPSYLNNVHQILNPLENVIKNNINKRKKYIKIPKHSKKDKLKVYQTLSKFRRTNFTRNNTNKTFNSKNSKEKNLPKVKVIEGKNKIRVKTSTKRIENGFKPVLIWTLRDGGHLNTTKRLSLLQFKKAYVPHLNFVYHHRFHPQGEVGNQWEMRRFRLYHPVPLLTDDDNSIDNDESKEVGKKVPILNTDTPTIVDMPDEVRERLQKPILNAFFGGKQQEESESVRKSVLSNGETLGSFLKHIAVDEQAVKREMSEEELEAMREDQRANSLMKQDDHKADMFPDKSTDQHPQIKDKYRETKHSSMERSYEETEFSSPQKEMNDYHSNDYPNQQDEYRDYFKQSKGRNDYPEDAANEPPIEMTLRPGDTAGSNIEDTIKRLESSEGDSKIINQYTHDPKTNYHHQYYENLPENHENYDDTSSQIDRENSFPEDHSFDKPPTTSGPSNVEDVLDPEKAQERAIRFSNQAEINKKLNHDVLDPQVPGSISTSEDGFQESKHTRPTSYFKDSTDNKETLAAHNGVTRHQVKSESYLPPIHETSSHEFGKNYDKSFSMGEKPEFHDEEKSYDRPLVNEKLYAEKTKDEDKAYHNDYKMASRDGYSMHKSNDEPIRNSVLEKSQKSLKVDNISPEDALSALNNINPSPHHSLTKEGGYGPPEAVVNEYLPRVNLSATTTTTTITTATVLTTPATTTTSATMQPNTTSVSANNKSTIYNSTKPYANDTLTKIQNSTDIENSRVTKEVMSILESLGQLKPSQKPEIPAATPSPLRTNENKTLHTDEDPEEKETREAVHDLNIAIGILERKLALIKAAKKTHNDTLSHDSKPVRKSTVLSQRKRSRIPPTPQI